MASSTSPSQTDPGGSRGSAGRKLTLGSLLVLAVSLAALSGAAFASGDAAPGNTSPPTIKGSPAEGGVLVADRGSWTSDSKIAYSYRWQSCLANGTGCADIAQANDQIYTPRPADVGRSIRVVVAATNRDGTGEAASSATAPVAAAPPQAPHNSALPTIGGTAAPGQILTAAPGTWTGSPPITFSYRWRRCDASGGACNETSVKGRALKPSAADGKHSFRVLVTGQNAAGTTASLSAPSAAVTVPSKPVNTSLPAVSGAPEQGSTLTGSRGAWSNNPSGYEYRWVRCNDKGSHCNTVGRGTTYRLGALDVGHTIRFAVKARNGAGAATALSAPTAPITAAAKPAPARPQVTSRPSISGVPQQGQVLRAGHGAWTSAPSRFDYAWTRCDKTGAYCDDIAGANGSSYSPAAADIGHTLRVKVTARNAGGSTIAFSAPTGVVSAAPARKSSPPTNSTQPRISGTAQEGKTLTGSAGTWNNGPTSYDYSWRRCNSKGDDCNGIDGAHATTYVLTGADVGHTIRFRVEARNADGSNTATSLPTSVVRASAAPGNNFPPTISGTAQQGKALTGHRGGWTHNPTDFDYAWLRCDHSGGSCAAIPGARSATYTMTAADVGNTLRFRVTATNSAGATTATSVPTGVVQKAPTPTPPPRPIGCPPRASIRQPANIATIAPPARLLVDTLQSEPRVVTRGTRVLIVRFHVTSTCGGPVQGALVYATATPYNQFAIPPEAATGADGWATLVFRRLRGFPVSRHQQLVAMFVRARKPGEGLLGGVSTRRLVSVRVELR
jgi:hypothetical protein